PLSWTLLIALAEFLRQALSRARAYNARTGRGQPAKEAPMLSREDNELLCRIGPGTPMGALMREYWVPAGLSSELTDKGGAPVRIRLLGEDLIAFRVSSGAVG